MAFAQVYYTSCKDGPGGYSGYQLSAATPGIAPAVVRDIEAMTAYRIPGRLLACPPAEESAYPVALSYGPSSVPDTTITAHVVYAGDDYSGRPGNYFAHALVTGTPVHDFGELLPAELWGADLWKRRPAPGRELPELDGPLTGGAVHLLGAQAFLEARADRGLVAELLTAVCDAMAGERPVLLAAADTADNAWWIAAVCYLLGDDIGRRVTFTTYSHQPHVCSFHVIGVMAADMPPGADPAFQPFDLVTGRSPGGAAHPVAVRLADAGVLGAAGLWRQAALFALGTETGLDGWLAPVALAAFLLGQPLTALEADHVARWIPGAIGRIPEAVADAVIGAALALPAALQSDQLLRELLDRARRLPASGRVQHIERLLAELVVSSISRGAEPVPVRLSPRSESMAIKLAGHALDQASPAVALAVLDWAAASGVALPDPILEAYGWASPDLGVDAPELTAMLGRYPAVLRGLLDRLEGEPTDLAEAVLSGDAAGDIRREDLVAHPCLTELWLLQSVERGFVEPMRALDEICDLRGPRDVGAAVDAALLGRLWPRGCSPAEAEDLLAVVGDMPQHDAAEWLAAQIGALVSEDAADTNRLRLARAVADHPILLELPESRGQAVSVAAALWTLLHDAATLGGYLHDCPARVRPAFGHELARRLGRRPADLALAGRVFAALAEPDTRRHPLAADTLTSALDGLDEWRADDLGELERMLEGSADSAIMFRAWRDERGRPAGLPLPDSPERSAGDC